MKIIYKKVSELIPYVNNPRKNDKAVDAVASSIKNYGFRNAILIDAKNEIINGHTRLKAAQKLGMLEVPCIMAEDLTPAQVKGLRIADNKVAEASEWDYDLLKIELDDIDDFTGFDLDDLNLNDKEITEDDFNTDEALENIEQPITKRGDIWKLGNHRLMCGDSTSVDDVEKLMDGKKADMVFTDPPYNVDYSNKNKFLNLFDKGNRIQKNIAGDNEKTDQKAYETLWKPAFEKMRNNANDDCSIYVTMPQGGAHMMMMMMAINDSGWKVKHELIWLKNNHVLGRVNYLYKHEPILFGWNITHKWYGNGEHTKSVWEINKPNKSELHPTMKPIALITNALLNSTKQNDIILDGFGGSGSTLIACEQTDRICYMMELDEKYCDVIIKRWETLTGKKAEKVV